MATSACRACSLPLPPRPLYPFAHKNRFLWYHYVTVPVFAVLLLPLRIACLGLCIAAAFLVSAVTQIGHDPRGPLSPWRRWVANAVLLRLAQAGMHLAGYLLVSTKGRRATVEEAPILVAAPHTSMFDIAAYFSCGPPLLAPVTKLSGNFFYSTMLPAGEALQVNRGSGKKGAAEQLQERACSGGRYQQLMMFPEGTCSNGSALLEFKTGAFAPGVPVQPVVVRHPGQLQLQCWPVDGPGLAEVIFRLGTQLYCELEVEYLPVYTPSAAERQDPKLYANSVRQLLARQLEVQLTDNSYADVLLVKVARRHRLRSRPGLVAFARVLRRLQMDSAELLSTLQQVQSGQLPAAGCPHKLSACLRLPPDWPQLRAACDLFEQRSDDCIDFREFLAAAAIVRSGRPDPDTFARILQALAQNGHVTGESARAAVRGCCLGADWAVGCVRTDEIDSERIQAFAQELEANADFHRMLQMHRELATLIL